MLSGFLGCCCCFGYIVVVVVHYPPALFFRAPLPRARWPNSMCRRKPIGVNDEKHTSCLFNFIFYCN